MSVQEDAQRIADDTGFTVAIMRWRGGDRPVWPVADVARARQYGVEVFEPQQRKGGES